MAGSIPASLSDKAASPVARSASRGSETWRRFRRHRLAVAGALILSLMCLGVMFGSLLWPVAINDIDFAATLQGPSLAHPFGTDDLGQDLLARMLYGGRISLAVGLSAMAVAMVPSLSAADSTMVSPAFMRSPISLAVLAVVERFLRSTKTQRCSRARKPKTGHVATSLLATKLSGMMEPSVRMSIHETWLATITTRSPAACSPA